MNAAHLNHDEIAPISGLVNRLLEQGNGIRVHDGEEWAERSAAGIITDAEAIMGDIGHTDETRLVVYTGRVRIGWVLLVHGVGGEDVIADHTCNLSV